MRPTSPVLRYAFRAAKAKLDSTGKKINVNSLASELGANFKTVQRFLYRDKSLAKEIGVELENQKHEFSEYADIIVNIPSDKRPTVRRIGAALNLDHSSVSRFLKAHPELRMLHPRFDGIRPVVKKVEREIEVSKPNTSVRRWRDIWIAVWHETACRYVGVSATKTEYLDYWRRGLLKHQDEGQPKPEHLPTPEEVELMT